MATRRVMFGDQEVEIPDFNFRLLPLLGAALALWLFTGTYMVGPDKLGLCEPSGNTPGWHNRG